MAPKQRCTFSPTTFSSVQFSSVARVCSVQTPERAGTEYAKLFALLLVVVVVGDEDVPARTVPTTICVSGGGARMPARSVCLVTLSLSEAGPGRFGS